MATSFALGPTLREMLESMLLLLHIRPFDVGDKVVFHGAFLRVVQIRLMSAVFHNAAHAGVRSREAGSGRKRTSPRSSSFSTLDRRPSWTLDDAARLEAGYRVVFCLARLTLLGRAVRSEARAMINTTDVFATVAELAGVDLASVVSVDRPLDSVSLVPYLHDPAAPSLRATVYAEQFHPNGFGPYESHDRAIRGPRYKLIVKELFTPQPARTEELYDLELDPFELADLLAAPGPLAPPAAQAYRQLARELEALLEPPVHTPPLVQEQ